jgi:hypothetical protein
MAVECIRDGCVRVAVKEKAVKIRHSAQMRHYLIQYNISQISMYFEVRSCRLCVQ